MAGHVILRKHISRALRFRHKNRWSKTTLLKRWQSIFIFHWSVAYGILDETIILFSINVLWKEAKIYMFCWLQIKKTGCGGTIFPIRYRMDKFCMLMCYWKAFHIWRFRSIQYINIILSIMLKLWIPLWGLGFNCESVYPYMSLCLGDNESTKQWHHCTFEWAGLS